MLRGLNYTSIMDFTFLERNVTEYVATVKQNVKYLASRKSITANLWIYTEPISATLSVGDEKRGYIMDMYVIRIINETK